MGLFRPRESLHERLAREGGLVAKPSAPQGPFWQEPGMTGHFRPREADAVVTVDAPDVEGDAVRFVSLPDGSLLVEDGADSSLDALAAAVEQALRPPYRARGVRRSEMRVGTHGRLEIVLRAVENGRSFGWIGIQIQDPARVLQCPPQLQPWWAVGP